MKEAMRRHHEPTVVEVGEGNDLARPWCDSSLEGVGNAHTLVTNTGITPG